MVLPLKGGYPGTKGGIWRRDADGGGADVSLHALPSKLNLVDIVHQTSSLSISPSSSVLLPMHGTS